MTAKYSSQQNTIQELPQMEEPSSLKSYWPDYKVQYSAYQAHVATLRTIPCRWPAEKQWKDGQILTEGVDYELRKADWIPQTEDEYNEALHDDKYELRGQIPQVLYAFPIVPAKSEGQLWNDAMNTFTNLRLQGHSYEECILALSKVYLITRKQ